MPHPRVADVVTKPIPYTAAPANPAPVTFLFLIMQGCTVLRFFLFKIGGFVEISPRIFKAYPMAHSGFHIFIGGRIYVFMC